MKFDKCIFFVIWVFSQVYMGNSAIYSFGDSLADTGNLLISDQRYGVYIGHLPYGESLGISTGRWSDGLLIVDYIAESLGYPLLNPYLKKDASFIGGVNFAVAGATALNASFFEGKGIGGIFTNLSLDTEIQWFLEYKKQFCLYNEECDQHFANATFLVGEIGGNDYNYPFLQGKTIDEVQTFVPLVVEKIRVALETLITIGGARKILIQNNYPIGCSPSYLSTINHDINDLDYMGCLKKYNEFASKGNQALEKMVKLVQKKYPDIKVVFADNYNAALEIIRKPLYYGFQPFVLRTCCGKGGKYNFNQQSFCGVGAQSCDNSLQYFNWDGIHLTGAAYKSIALKLLNGEFTKPPFRSIFGN